MGSFVSCMSNILYISEKITVCTTCTALICCLVLTITMSLAMGIGLGYNYCFVGMRTKYENIKGQYIDPGSLRWPYKREETSAEELKDNAENYALRKPRHKTEHISILPNIIKTPTRVLKKPRFKTTTVDDENTNYYRPMIFDPESYNETSESSSVKTTFEAISNATNVDPETTAETSITTSIRILESSSTTNSTNFYESISTTASIIEATTEIKDNNNMFRLFNEPSELNEPRPTPTTLKDSNSRKVKKLIIPITGLDLISLLSRLSAENKNYSLQVVTT